MKWIVKALVYATLLTLPGHWIAPAYQSLLLAITSVLIGRPLAMPAEGAVDLSAANLLTILAALSLASEFVSWPRRLRALGLGILGTVAIECATGIVAMNLDTGPGPGATGSRGPAMVAQMLELSRWLAVPFLWGLLLGRHALRSGSAEAAAGTVVDPGAAR